MAELSFQALRRRGVQRPGEHIAVIAPRTGIWPIEILTKESPFTADELDRLQAFADADGFVSWYLPGRPDRQQSEFRVLLEGSSSERKTLISTMFLDISATTDDRPFFFSYYRWKNLLQLQIDPDKPHTWETGHIVLALILALSIVLSTLAVLLPLLRRRRALLVPHAGQFLLYFAALGVGFIFLEISPVQSFVLLLGYPTYALTVVLSSFLIGAGIGARLGERLPNRPAQVLPTLTAALTLALFLYAVGSPPVFAWLLGSPFAVRAGFSALLLLPIGALLGTFFPYGTD